MSAINVRNIQEVRRRTGAGMLQCKTTLERTRGDVSRAIDELRLLGVARAEPRTTRPTGEGLITSYAHHNGKIGVLVEVNCETDFVARTDDFRALARHLAEHIAAAAPVAVDRDQMPPDVVARKREAFEDQVRLLGKPEQLAEKIVDGKMEAYFRGVVLMDQEWVREPKLTIRDLIRDVSARTGEAIRVRRFARFHMGIA
jgi:elongation factor Ts